MNYKECLRYLEDLQNLGIKFGLDNVRTILNSLNNPHQKYPSVLVAGTNGKGSVCAMLSHILSLHGLRTGLFTSPHLVRVEERIKIGNKSVSSKDFCRELTRLKKMIEELISSEKLLSPPTYFELLTCLAFQIFEKERIDMAILEVGMGGRFDATNVVLPEVSVITTISKEHQKFLGKTLDQIAFEKAGIIKQGIPVVCGVKKGVALAAIKKRAKDLSSPFYSVFERKNCFHEEKEKERYYFFYESKKAKYNYSPLLQGKHQGENAAIAIAACDVLSQRWMPLDREVIIQGIEETRWEGRLEIFSRCPLVIMDGAHNEEGVKALKSYINEFVPVPRILVVAFMRDKKIKRIADILFPLAEQIIITRFPYFRGASPEDVKAEANKFREKILLEPDVRRAVKKALSMAGLKGCILIAGSLYLVGEVKKIYPHRNLLF